MAHKITNALLGSVLHSCLVPTEWSGGLLDCHCHSGTIRYRYRSWQLRTWGKPDPSLCRITIWKAVDGAIHSEGCKLQDDGQVFPVAVMESEPVDFTLQDIINDGFCDAKVRSRYRTLVVRVNISLFLPTSFRTSLLITSNRLVVFLLCGSFIFSTHCDFSKIVQRL